MAAVLSIAYSSRLKHPATDRSSGYLMSKRYFFILLTMQGAAGLIVPAWQSASIRSKQLRIVPAASRSGLSSVRCDLPELDGTGAFKNIQEYPCDLDVKVIGNNEGPFVSDIVTLCAENTGMKEEDIQVRWRDKGKYRAITLRLHFDNSEQVRGLCDI